MASLDTPPGLDDQLCFSLYSASMAVSRTYKPLLDGLGITYPQYLVLCALWERDPQSVGTIAERLALDSSTITPLIKRLVTAGLIHRERNPHNERQVLVSLTEAGKDMRGRSACLAERLASVSGFSVERLRLMARDVRSLRDAVAGPAAEPR